MSRGALKTIIVIDAVAIIGYAITTWSGGYLPTAFLVAVVAAMVAQIAVVAQRDQPALPASSDLAPPAGPQA